MSARQWAVVFVDDRGHEEVEATYRTQRAAIADVARRRAALTAPLYFMGWKVVPR